MSCKLRKLILISIVALNFLSFSSQAFEAGGTTRCWHAFASVAGGILVSSNIGESQNFPIQDPVVDSFYNYSQTSGSQAAKFGNATIGVEWILWWPDFAFQLGVDYTQAASVTVNGNLTQGADVQSQDSYTYSYDVSLRQILLSGKLLGTFYSRFHPYVFGGIGVGFSRASDFQTSVPPFLTFTRMYDSNTSNSFSYAVGFGLDVELDQVFRVGLGYRFADYGKVSLGDAVIDTTPVSGTLSQSRVYANEFFAQVTVLLGAP